MSTTASGPGDWETRANAVVEENRARALREAEAVLGPLGQLADVRRFTEISASELVEQFRQDSHRPTAVLQLLVDGTGLLDDGTVTRGAPVLRRLTWTEGDGVVHEHVSLAATSWISPGDLDSTTNVEYWVLQDAVADLLLPPELTDLLLRCSETRPARLLVVPTGALAVAFDALPLGPDGPVLGQRAATVISGSLTTAAALSQSARAQHITYDEGGQRFLHGISVYEPGHVLPGAEEELQALRRALGEGRVRSAVSLADIQEMLAHGSGTDLLAMGVHGHDDEDGWGQSKTLPSGENLNSVDILSLDLPPLCVLASCWSSIRQRRGGELGGMPLAMILRGARTVIGTLHAVNDAATGQIMSLAWPLLAAGEPPADALFHARRQWMTPERLQEPLLWAGLVTYGHL